LDLPNFASTEIAGTHSMTAVTKTICIGLILAAALLPAAAGEWFGHKRTCGSQSCCEPVYRRCDDYCGKPAPCLAVLLPCRRCDDYCEKPFPCQGCLPARRCDDYCTKPFPCVRPICWTSLWCAPPCAAQPPAAQPAAVEHVELVDEPAEPAAKAQR
jgi:hypothetical protein